MNAIAHLYSSLYEEGLAKRPRELVKLVDQNQLHLLNTNLKPGLAAFDQLRRILADYGFALAELDYLDKAVLILNQAINLFERSQTTTFFNAEEYYEKLRLKRGIIKFRLKQYKNSKSDFRYLVQSYPENKSYRLWLNRSISAGIQPLVLLCAVACFIILGAAFFITKVQIILFIISVAFVAAAIILEVYASSLKK